MDRHLLLLLAATLPLVSHAGDYPSSELEAGYTFDSLNNGYANWRSAYLEGARELGKNHTVYGTLRKTDRFNERDSEAMAGWYYPLAKNWIMQAQGSYSPTHNILARWSGLAQLGHVFEGGWGAYLGASHREYSAALTNAGIFTLEKYWSNYRIAYINTTTALAGSGSADSSRIQFTRYYGGRNSIGLDLSDGNEIDNIGPPLGILKSHVRAIDLRGRHWISRNWAAAYEIGTVRQGNFYTRNIFRLGLRHRF